MLIKQISVFMENSTIHLGKLTRVLFQAGVNIRAISITDSASFGISRLIVDKCNEAIKALDDNGFTARVSEVSAVEIEDTPGSLAEVMEYFQKAGINIEYVYSSLGGKDGKVVVIFKLEDHQKGLQILKEDNIHLVESF